MLAAALNGKMSIEFGLGMLNPGAYLTQAKKTSEYYYPYMFFMRHSLNDIREGAELQGTGRFVIPGFLRWRVVAVFHPVVEM
jgi:hypothetical protein